MESLINQENNIEKNNKLMAINLKNDEFEILMKVYKKALDSALKNFSTLKQTLNQYYGYEVINNIKSRIKSKQSIINKIRKKKYELTYENIIENIDDIAGLRIICTYKDDIYKIRKMISQINEIQIIKEKDYIKNPKKSGYSAYHIIIEVPIKIKNQNIYIKVEIQIRTMLMDFWASTEHKIKYKTDKKLSRRDSRKLTRYAKIINLIGDDMMKIYKKQNVNATALLE